MGASIRCGNRRLSFGRSNKRKFYVYLTPEGAALRDVLVPLAEEVNRIAVDGLPPEHLRILRDALLRMIANLAAEENAT